MNTNDDVALTILLRSALKPVTEGSTGIDLWSNVAARLDKPRVQMNWRDWILLAIILVLCVAVPGAFQSLLCNL